MSRDKKLAGEWGVFDMNARELDPDKPGKTLPRTHEPVKGVTYPLFFSKACWMPEAHARVFLKDASFQVIDNAENVVPGLAKEALQRTLPQALPANLVIADLKELTTEALLTRAAQRQGGGRLTGSTSRETLLDFLMDGLEADTVAQGLLPSPRSTGTGQDDPNAGDVDDTDEDDAATMAEKMLQGA